MTMGISWNYSIRYTNNDYDNRSLTTSELFCSFSLFTQYLLVLVFMMCFAVAFPKKTNQKKGNFYEVFFIVSQQ